MNWHNIRSLNNSQQEGFEEFVCQLARKEKITNSKEFIRKGKPDAGVECFWVLHNSDEIAWQAKFFTISLEKVQWKQIDKSVKTALAKHKKLRKYFIAIPLDPPDARIEGQDSMLDKWNNHIEKWEKWALKEKMSVEFIPWWSSHLIEKLQKPENAGLAYFWFHKEEFSDAWLREQPTSAILDLGTRYTPEINVKLEISTIFNGLFRNEQFQDKATKLFDDFLTHGNKVTNFNDSQESLKLVYSLFQKTDFKDVTKPIPAEKFLNLLHPIRFNLLRTQHYNSNTDTDTDTDTDTPINNISYNEKLYQELSYRRDWLVSTNQLVRFIESTMIKLANNPFLLLEGDAGVGKSHLLADVVTRRNENSLFSLFFLGQHFTTDEDPWTQILKKCDTLVSADVFLETLNSKAQISRQRIIIFIDAVNEGRGKYFWNNNIRSFLAKIKKYEWLGLVLSVRTTYSELMFPKDKIKNNEIIRYTHHGFAGHEYEASTMFFNNFGLEQPNTPLLHPEFQNPLFLLLFCKGLKKSHYTKIPDGLQGITSVIDFFVNSVNTNLATPNRLNSPSSINLVKKSIKAIVEYTVETNLQYIPYEQAYLLLNKISREFGIDSSLLDELIHEGLLSKSILDSQKGEIVHFTYERFADHTIADFLLDKNPEITKAFKNNGSLFFLVENINTCYMYQGVIEALSIQLPEKTGQEFHEYVPHLKGCYPIVSSFIKSLLWRKHDTISEKLLDYVNSVVSQDYRSHILFWETILSVTAVPGHYFNANFLHKHLFKFSLADRDASWTMYLKDKLDSDSAVKRLLDWAWSNHNKKQISDDAIKLASIALSWFHTSTNRKLRDSATKALVCLLENRIHILLQLLKKFEGVNDPYIYERLFAVAYGCATRTKQTNKLKELSNYIYLTIFKNTNEVYPHILLRDYARGVIEFTAYLGYNFDFNIVKIRPPYKSTLPRKFPTNKEIDDIYRLDYTSKNFKDYYWSQNYIIDSMTTAGQENRPYGDFGRYVFQRAFLYTWDVNAHNLSNLAIEWIFKKYGYDKEKHGEFDREIGSGQSRTTMPNERIGKKYQWIAFYEILAKVSDNYAQYKEWKGFKKETQDYQGPWIPYVRDIDPTMTIQKTGESDKEISGSFWWVQEKYENWNMGIDSWFQTDTDLPNSEKLMQAVDREGEEWLILEGYPEWIEPKSIGQEDWALPRKNIWYQLRSYLVSKDNYENIRNWASNQDFMGRWMPESSSRYEVFSREYYWSPAYDYFSSKEYYGSLESSEIYETSTDKRFNGKVILTSNSFLWENEFDKSKKYTIKFLKPSQYLYNNMKMNFSKKEGEFIDQSGQVICFDPSVYHGSKSYLLIKKNSFLTFLQENNLKILWTVLGEKNTIGGSFNDKYRGRLEISGAYYLDEYNKLHGNIHTKFI